ncbi:MAG TPA: magnesium transporter [Acidimicrobiales bacterium]|jgi:mgtE-like transporter|nr:magnesium transporter [Acidimicrobiales bacterium]
MRRFTPPVARLHAVLGFDLPDAGQSLVALGMALLASLIAGLTLGAITDTLEDLPGLLILIPAATGLRGTIAGALGARLGTAIHSGTFRVSSRADTVLGQNVLAAGALTLFASVVLAVLAKVVSVGVGVERSISVADFVVISVVGGVLASAVVLALTVLLAAGSARYGWDPDNVTSPVVTATGDMVTLPALFLATLLVDIDIVTPLIAAAGAVVALMAITAALSTRLMTTRRIVRESVVVVVGAGMLSLVAGQTLEQRLDDLVRFPALLALVPPFLAAAGAIGGILSSRLTSKLHLGTLEPDAVPGRAARYDVLLAYVLGFPVFVGASIVADLAAALIDLRSPGPVDMAFVALLGGFLATSFAIGVAYYAAVVSYRAGLDPDNVGIPLVTSSLDLIGAVCFVLAVVAVGAA